MKNFGVSMIKYFQRHKLWQKWPKNAKTPKFLPTKVYALKVATLEADAHPPLATPPKHNK